LPLRGGDLRSALYAPEIAMGKEQRSTKEAKKPKADKSPPKPMNPNHEPVIQPRATVIMERGKKKTTG
jgi:hypothetical protein